MELFTSTDKLEKLVTEIALIERKKGGWLGGGLRGLGQDVTTLPKEKPDAAVEGRRGLAVETALVPANKGLAEVCWVPKENPPKPEDTVLLCPRTVPAKKENK